MRRRTPRSSAARNKLERDALSFLNAHDGQLLAFARELVATPSPNPPGDERRVMSLAAEQMSALGYTNLKTVAMDPTRPNLVGEVAGLRRHPCLLLNGHLDTKPVGEISDWATGPLDPVVRDGRLYGLGSADMKGAVAAMVFAGAALANAGISTGTLRVGLTADEEAGSLFGARFVADREEFLSDAVLVGEPTGMQSSWAYIAVASRGLACFVVSVRGTQMHSSLSDEVPSINASVKLAEVMSRMAREFRPGHPGDDGAYGHVTVNLGVTLQGGVYFGVYPGHAEFGVDVRTLPGMTLAGLSADVDAFLDVMRREDPQLDVRSEPVAELEWMPPSSIDPSHGLVAAAQGAAKDVLGREVRLGTMPAFTDASHWARTGRPCIPALGPGSLLVAHQPNESVAVEEISQAARIYALTALRYFAGAAAE